MATERKNIHRNATRPKAKDTPFHQGRGHGDPIKRDREINDELDKLASWSKL